MKLISQGAEAKLFEQENKIIKDRFEKKYRVEQIDQRLRKSRTKREAKVLSKLRTIDFPCPILIDCDGKEKIVMQKIQGPRVRDILEKSDYIKMSKEIGKKIAIMHNNQIIHGDLTTSNMIHNKDICFIDFGLSFFSYKIEDKAVDLHLLKQALESKHYTIWEKCFNAVLQSYEQTAEQGNFILQRLEKVEQRGRYKKKASKTFK